MPLDSTLALEHVRRLNIEGTIQAGLPTLTLYDSLSFDPASILSGYRYSGKIQSLNITADRYIRLRFWVQLRSGRRVTITEVNNYDEAPLQGAIAAGLYIGHGSTFGVTCLDPLAEGQIIEIFGLVEEQGTVVPTGFGEAPPHWGNIAGEITMQADLVQALATKASMVQVEEAIDAAITDQGGQGGNQAALLAEAQARAAGDEANAQAIAAEAQIRTLGAAENAQRFAAEAQARADGDAINAQAIAAEAQARAALTNRVALLSSHAYTEPPDPLSIPRWREVNSAGVPLYDYDWIWIPEASEWGSEVVFWLTSSSQRITSNSAEGNLSGYLPSQRAWAGVAKVAISKAASSYNLTLRKYTNYANTFTVMATKLLPVALGNTAVAHEELPVNQVILPTAWRITWQLALTGANSQSQDAGLSVSLPLRLLRP